jgi:hypothetical protein
MSRISLRLSWSERCLIFWSCFYTSISALFCTLYNISLVHSAQRRYRPYTLMNWKYRDDKPFKSFPELNIAPSNLQVSRLICREANFTSYYKLTSTRESFWCRSGANNGRESSVTITWKTGSRSIWRLTN